MLDLPDVAFFAWMRGPRSFPGERGAAENFGAMVKDVDAFVRHIAERTASRSRTSLCWRTAWARSQSRRGCTITRRRFAG